MATAGLALLLGTCGSDGEVDVPLWRCTVADPAGITYQGEAEDELSALEAAMTRCEIDTHGPAYCASRGCQSPW